MLNLILILDDGRLIYSGGWVVRPVAALMRQVHEAFIGVEAVVVLNQ